MPTKMAKLNVKCTFLGDIEQYSAQTPIKMEDEQAITCFVCQKILNSVSTLQIHLEKEHGDGSNIEMGAGAFQMDRDENPDLEIHKKVGLLGCELHDQNCKESITEERPSQASCVQTSKAVRGDVTKGTTVSHPAVQFQENSSTSDSDSDDYNAQDEGFENESLNLDSCGSPGKTQYWRREKVVLKKLPLCEQCGTAFTTKTDFGTHLNNCPGIVRETQKRQQAEKQNSSRTQFKKLSRKVQCKAYVCPICGKKLLSREGLIYHKTTHNKFRTRPHACSKCGQRYYRKTHLNDHILSSHPDTMHFKCNTCGKMFLDKTELDRHSLHSCTHKGGETQKKENARKQKVYKCPVCGKILGSRSGFSYHIITHNSSRPRPYSCDRCDKSFYRKYHLKEHMDIFHEQLFRFECKICGKRYSRSRPLTQHLKKSCKKSLQVEDTEKSRLKEEVEVGGNVDNEAHIHHGTENKKCPAETSNKGIEQMKEYEVICEDEQQSLVNVKKEEVEDWENEYKEASIHNQAENDKYPGKTRYQGKENVLKKLPSCEVCGTAFTSKPDFETHLNTCPGIVRETQKRQQAEKQNSSRTNFKNLSIKPHCNAYVCPLCGKRLQSREGLISHKTTHNESRTRPHACSKCGIRYYRKTHLYTHIRSCHPGMMSFKCSACGKMFMDKKGLDQHLRYSCRMSLKVKAIENGQRMPEAKQKEDEASKMESEREVNDRIVTEQPRLPSDSMEIEIEQKEVKHQHRMSTHNSARLRPHSCDQCGKSYYNTSHLKEHIDSAHLKLLRFECKCGKKYSRSSLLYNHSKRSCKMLKRSEEANTAKLESEESKDKETRTKEKARKRKVYMYECPVCGKILRSCRGMLYHRRTHDSSRPRPYSCDHCGKGFYQKHHLKEHIDSFHLQLPRFECKICGKRFTRSFGLSKHLKKSCRKSLIVEDTEKSLLVSKEKEEVEVGGNEDNEAHIHHGTSMDREIEQNEVKYGDENACESQTSEESTVQTRENEAICKDEPKPLDKLLTDNKKEKTCRVCGKAFTYSSNLNRHMNTHNSSRPRPYSCDQCGKTYCQKCHLKKHIDIAHLKLLSFECEACGKKYARSHLLNRHLRYSCNVLRRMEEGNNLQLEKEESKAGETRTQEKQKVYECPICGKILRSYRGMLYHRRTHDSSRPRPYSCDHCGKGFYQKHHLKEHMAGIHLQLPCLESKIRGKRYTRSRYLPQHLIKSCKKSLKVEDTEKSLHVSEENEEVEERENEDNEAHIHDETKDDLAATSFKINEKEQSMEDLYNNSLRMSSRTKILKTDLHDVIISRHPDMKQMLEQKQQNSIHDAGMKEKTERERNIGIGAAGHELAPDTLATGIEQKTVTDDGKRICVNGAETRNEDVEQKNENEVRFQDELQPLVNGFTDLKENQKETTLDALISNSGKISSKENVEEHVKTSKQKVYECPVCGNSFRSYTRWCNHKETHNPSESRLRPHACTKCGKRYYTKPHLTEHILRNHPETTHFECNTCGKKFMEKRLYDRHLQKLCNQKPYSCPDCGKSFRAFCRLRSHRETHNSSRFRPHACDRCGKRFHRTRNLKDHIDRVHLALRTVRCRACGKTYLRQSDLNQHLKDSCKILMRVEEAGDFQFTPEEATEKELHKTIAEGTGENCTIQKTIDIVQGNIENENKGITQTESSSKDIFTQPSQQRKQPVHSCKVCGKEYLTIHGLRKHTERHNPTRRPRPFTCKICGKGMLTENYLKSHMENFHFMVRVLSEDNAQQKACGENCDRGLQQDQNTVSNSVEAPNDSNINHDVREIKKISDTGYYQCPLCEHTEKNKLPLRLHMRECHTTHDRYLCDICGKFCFTNSALKKHLESHAPKPPINNIYACEFCGKTFLSATTLIFHVNRHKEDKHFKCNWCDYRCVEEAHLKNHMKSHSKDKPYTCAVCHKAFKRRENLKHHKRIHTGEKPFKCDVCKKCFTHSAGLYLHKMRKEKCG